MELETHCESTSSCLIINSEQFIDSETSLAASSINLLHCCDILKTFLSPSVHTLVVNQFSSSCNIPSSPILSAVINSSLSLNWAAIETIISENIKNDDTFLDHQKFSRELIVITRHVYTSIMTRLDHSILNRMCTWTHNSKIYNECLELLLFKGSPLDVHLCLLLLTSAIERSLGDVYMHLSKARVCPKLLKDLLASKELENALGKFPMFCLQCLIGPPSGFNLRNIAWHGFFIEGEIPVELVVFLLVTIYNFQQSLVPMVPIIIHRPFITFPQESVIEGVFPDFKESDIDCISQLFFVSYFVAPLMASVWQSALSYYRLQKYGYFVSIILPCLEHSLRHVFAHCNHCPERVLTAESSVLYTTFDEILSPTLHDGTLTNHLPNEIGGSYMELLLDLLVHPEGPRLRDRISHGEVDPVVVSKTLADHVLGIIVSFCCRYSKSVNDKITRSSCVSIACGVADDYQSLFHPSSILKRELLELLSEMSKWVIIGRYHGNVDSSDLRVNIDFFENYQTTLEHLVGQFPIIKAASKVSSDPASKVSSDPASKVLSDPASKVLSDPVCIVEHLTDPTTFNDFNTKYIESLVKQVWNRPIKTLYMTRNDLEITGLLRRLVSHLITAIRQILVTANERYQSHANWNMRSRQRANFNRLLSNIGLYWSCSLMTCVLVCMGVSCYPTPQSVTNKTICFYKKVLQFTENFLSQTLPSKNCWEEGERHCKLLIQHCNKLSLLQ